MKEPRQRVMESLGKEGCYFLCLVDIAEEVLGERIDAVPAFLRAVEEGLVQMNCLVNDAAAVLMMLTGVGWSKDYKDSLYVPRESDFEILKYERKNGTGTVVHFVRPGYDPYGDSRTVREGRLESKRVFRRI